LRFFIRLSLSSFDRTIFGCARQSGSVFVLVLSDPCNGFRGINRSIDRHSIRSTPLLWWPSSLGAPAPSRAYPRPFSIGRAVRPRRSADYMRIPGEQRPVIHRELRIIRRISREDLQDHAQDSIIEGNLNLTNGDSHE
jgi:hypothetical protein